MRGAHSSPIFFHFLSLSDLSLFHSHINSLVGLFQKVHGASFTEAEIQTPLLTNAVTNSCS
jgi:hypothetical protein